MTSIDLDIDRNPEYPAHDPDLPEIPGVELRFDIDLIHSWRAFHNGMLIAKSPWKKLTWKAAKAFMENHHADQRIQPGAD